MKQHDSRVAVEARQRLNYDAIASEYHDHYDDPLSTRYRYEFFYDRIFAGVDLNGKRVLDAMCGTGGSAQYLLARGARVTGLDISPSTLQRYTDLFPAAAAVEASILDTKLPDRSFDVVVIIGGLHHVQPHVSDALSEVHRLLEPGGIFAFVEPPAHTLVDVARKLWYRLDRYFSDNEAAIDLDRLLEHHRSRFEPVSVHHGGGPGYFLVFNSLVLRIPHTVKNVIGDALIRFDHRLEGRWFPRCLSSYVTVQLRKR